MAPNTAPVLNAQGRVAFRKGNLAEAERFFRKALAADRKYPDALVGLAEINSAVSRFKSAQSLIAEACRLNPLDPGLALFRSSRIEDAEDEAALQKTLVSLDPASERARSLRAHLSRYTALHGRKPKLISAVEPAQIKLTMLSDGPRRAIGLGVKVQLNGKTVVRLKLDTGAGGIAISPQVAKRAGLEILGNESIEARGLGDKTADESFSFLAERLRIGDVEWANYPVAVFRGAKEPDTDGLIGTDVFSRFRVTIDFPGLAMSLEPGVSEAEPNLAVDATKRPEGFSGLFRFGHLLTIATSLNGSANRLFLIDSGSTLNLVDIHAAQDSTKVRQQDLLRLRGVQGEVKDVRRAEKGTLTFAGFQQQNPDLTAVDLHRLSDSTGAEVSGIIGMAVLWHMRMSIDYASGSVKLERSPSDPR